MKITRNNRILSVVLGLIMVLGVFAVGGDSVAATAAVTSTISGSLVQRGDYRLYAISISGPDGAYTITSTAGFDAVGSLYRSNGTFIDTDDDSAGSRQFLMTENLTGHTTYFLLVSAYSNSSTGNFTISIAGASSVSITPDTTTRFISMDAQNGNRITYMTAAYNQTINAPAAPTRPGYVFDGWYTAVTGGTQISFPYIVSTNIDVYAHWTGSGNGDDYGSSIAAAYLLGNNVTYEALPGDIEIAGDQDYFKFTPASSAVYCIYSGGSLDTVGTLYNAAGELIVSNDDSMETLNFYIEAALVAGQTYYVRVSDIGDSTGYYSVTVNIQGVTYQSHVQDIGWQDWSYNGSVSGTSAQSKRLEAIRINLGADGSIEYRTHVQDLGWMDWVSDGDLSGTSGQSKRLEAIQIRLNGPAEEMYDVYYCVHAQNYGWLDWAKNGESSGTAGYGYRLEAIRVVLVPKGEAAPGPVARTFVDLYAPKPIVDTVSYQTHVQDIGWQAYVCNAEMSGTSGESKRLEAIRIKLENMAGGIEYSTHVQDVGWMNFVADDALSGTSGESKRLEAIKIRLTGAAAEKYDVYYCVHAQNTGWLDWAKNGESAGTAGFSYRLEAIKIVLVMKGAAAPGPTARTFVQG
ncbi:MAG: InlB B-repeat-containing protein [Eubacteriales bacterium]